MNSKRCKSHARGSAVFFFFIRARACVCYGPGSMESAGWGSHREPPAVDGASPNTSEIDMMDFLQEVGERRLKEEAAAREVITQQ